MCDVACFLSEYTCGSEAEFVNQMNERAKGLGMTGTHFENCNGLEAEGHVICYSTVTAEV